MGTAKKQVATKEATDVAPANAWGEYQGVGSEDTSSSDYAIPFLNLLQSGSPQVEDNQPDGAKAGMYHNSVTDELYETFVFQPCAQLHKVVEWKPRGEGGGGGKGFVAVHELSSEVYKEALTANGGSPYGKLKNPKNGNDLIETYYMYGNILNDKGTEIVGFAVVPFSSTKIKSLKNFNTSVDMIKGRPPKFAHRMLFSSTKEKNSEGQSYYTSHIGPFKDNWKVSMLDPTKDAEMLSDAMGFREMVLSGEAVVNYEQQDAAGNTGDGGGGKGGAGGDDDVPF